MKPAYPGSCGRFIMGSVNAPSRLCSNLKRDGEPFCRACTNYVRFAMHRSIPDHWAREHMATLET